MYKSICVPKSPVLHKNVLFCSINCIYVQEPSFTLTKVIFVIKKIYSPPISDHKFNLHIRNICTAQESILFKLGIQFPTNNSVWYKKVQFFTKSFSFVLEGVFHAKEIYNKVQLCTRKSCSIQ